MRVGNPAKDSHFPVCLTKDRDETMKSLGINAVPLFQVQVLRRAVGARFRGRPPGAKCEYREESEEGPQALPRFA